MGKPAKVVRLSSKGQIVIPAAVRRRMGLKTGQSLAVRTGSGGEIVLFPVDRGLLDRDLDEMRRRLQSASRRLGGDPLAELEERRRQERLAEGLKHERRGH